MRVGLFIPALAYSALIIFLSSLSDLTPPDVGVELSDKLIHFVEYTVFSFLWGRAFLCFDHDRLSPAAVLTLIAGGILFAALDEYHQSFVPNRQADLRDLAADIGGILAGCFLATAWQRVQCRFRRMPCQK